jgi:hypothetical protein
MTFRKKPIANQTRMESNLCDEEEKEKAPKSDVAARHDDRVDVVFVGNGCPQELYAGARELFARRIYADDSGEAAGNLAVGFCAHARSHRTGNPGSLAQSRQGKRQTFAQEISLSKRW